MDISSVLKILILIKLMSLSMLDVDAAFRSSNVKTTPQYSTLPTKGTPLKKYYYIGVRIINYSQRRALLFTNFTGIFKETSNISPFGGTYNFDKKLPNRAIYRIKAEDGGQKEKFTLYFGNKQTDLFVEASEVKVIRTFYIKVNLVKPSVTKPTKPTVPSTTETTTKMKNGTSTTLPTTAEVPSTAETIVTTKMKNETSSTLPTTPEHSSEANHGSSSNKDKINKTTEKAYKHDEHEHKLMFYFSIVLGSAFVILLFFLVILLGRRSFRKRKEKRARAVYWAKINRACQSQYIPNEEVSTNNPMYEGSRSRTTSNVLYGVPDQDDITSRISRKNDYASNPLTQQSTKPDVVISNNCALYQNADELHSDTKLKVPEDVGNGHYERIRSFIENQNNEVKGSAGSYAEPSMLFNGVLVTENTGYVSAVHKTN